MRWVSHGGGHHALALVAGAGRRSAGPAAGKICRAGRRSFSPSSPARDGASREPRAAQLARRVAPDTFVCRRSSRESAVEARSARPGSPKPSQKMPCFAGNFTERSLSSVAGSAKRRTPLPRPHQRLDLGQLLALNARWPALRDADVQLKRGRLIARACRNTRSRALLLKRLQDPSRRRRQVSGSSAKAGEAWLPGMVDVGQVGA
jgi:hypothetical protein